MFCIALYLGEKKKKVEVTAANPCPSWLDIIKTNARNCCIASRVLIPQLHWGRLWTVLEICGVIEESLPNILSLGFQFYYGLGLGESLGTGEEEAFPSENQEQEDIDGTGEVEHWDREKHSRWRYIVVTEQ